MILKPMFCLNSIMPLWAIQGLCDYFTAAEEEVVKRLKVLIILLLSIGPVWGGRSHSAQTDAAAGGWR